MRGRGRRRPGAMSPADCAGAGSWLVRPLLPVGRAQLEGYRRARGLTGSRIRATWMSASIAIICAGGAPGAAAALARGRDDRRPQRGHLAEAGGLLEERAAGQARRRARRCHVAGAVSARGCRCSCVNALSRGCAAGLSATGSTTPARNRRSDDRGARDAQPLVRWPAASCAVMVIVCMRWRWRGQHSASAALEEHTLEEHSWDWRRQPWAVAGRSGRPGRRAMTGHGELAGWLHCRRCFQVRYRRGAVSVWRARADISRSRICCRASAWHHGSAQRYHW